MFGVGELVFEGLVFLGGDVEGGKELVISVLVVSQVAQPQDFFVQKFIFLNLLIDPVLRIEMQFRKFLNLRGLMDTLFRWVLSLLI